MVMISLVKMFIYIYILLFIYIWNYIVFKWIDKLLNNCLINDATTAWNHTNQGLKTWFIGLKKLLFYYLIEQDSLWSIPNIPEELTKNVTYGKYCIIIILWWIISFFEMKYYVILQDRLGPLRLTMNHQIIVLTWY